MRVSKWQSNVSKPTNVEKVKKGVRSSFEKVRWSPEGKGKESKNKQNPGKCHDLFYLNSKNL